MHWKNQKVIGLKNNILDILDNVGSIFIGVYLHYKDVPSKSEESIAERTKLRRKRSDEIPNKEKMNCLENTLSI